MASPSILRESITNGFDKDKRLRHKKRSSKIFCDPVHGQITVHPVCVAIIDTPQFQRLRRIKQTGFTEYVYHGSSHNRFGHSLGVYHLASKFLQELKERQPELKLSDTDILCVEIAGLCHDLGHGPFSHTWENYMKVIGKKRNEQVLWKHENVSVTMLDWLIEENELLPILKEHGIGPRELNQIKQYILGTPPRDPNKAFLYQIINNDDSGLDVDKFDYFLRDCLHLGLPCSFEYERLMQYAKVHFVDGKAQICFRDKTLESVYNVFRTRSSLHRLAYQHKVIITIEQMFLDALEMVDDVIVGLNGEVLRLYDWSMAAAYGKGQSHLLALKKFCTLTDDFLFTCMKMTSQPPLKRASSLVQSIDRRSSVNTHLYHHIGLKILSKTYSEEDILDGMCEFFSEAHINVLMSSSANAPPIWVTREDICVIMVPVNWGKGSQNPVESVYFYSKDDMYVKKGPKEGVSSMPPIAYEEIQMHVICRRSDEYARKVVQYCYDKFCESQEL